MPPPDVALRADLPHPAPPARGDPPTAAGSAPASTDPRRDHERLGGTSGRRRPGRSLGPGCRGPPPPAAQPGGRLRLQQRSRCPPRGRGPRGPRRARPMRERRGRAAEARGRPAPTRRSARRSRVPGTPRPARTGASATVSASMSAVTARPPGFPRRSSMPRATASRRTGESSGSSRQCHRVPRPRRPVLMRSAGCGRPGHRRSSR